MNTSIFPDSDVLMRNICGLTQYLENRGIETLHVVFTKDGKPFYRGEEGCYRVYDFIENTVVYQVAESADVLKESGKAFGEFQSFLADYDSSELVEVVKHYHDTPKRFRDFLSSLNSDILGRSINCKKEIDFVLSHSDTFSKIVEGINDGSVPIRVAHNDTKLNNILMDKDTNKARAIIDLDTVMPGSLLFDFGDSIRFGASTAREDEQDLSKVHFDITLFQAYAEGFCNAVRGKITQNEIDLLPYSAYLMTIECGSRFLADYLSGDVVFLTQYTEHNLIRARTQFRLAGEMERQFDKMSAIIDKIL